MGYTTNIEFEEREDSAEVSDSSYGMSSTRYRKHGAPRARRRYFEEAKKEMIKKLGKDE